MGLPNLKMEFVYINAINGGEDLDKNIHEIEAELESIKENYNDPLSECLFFQLSSMIAHVKKIADKMERDLIELPGEITKKISDEGDLKDKKDKDRFNSYLIAILNI